MSFIQLKPGPVRLAAALVIAGFSESKTIGLTSVTDHCGKKWRNPSELLLALATVGGESSGNAYATHTNEDGSTDYGLMQINYAANAAYWEMTSPITGVLWSWSHYLDNAWAGYQIYRYGIDKLKKPPFSPWNAYTRNYYLNERYNGKSWVDWAYHGITQMNSTYAALKAAYGSAAYTQIAGMTDDQLSY